tara:strand:+ start:108 stop:347 length:240 start_codon:yes stop_codon:yes gene_type:complete
MPSFSARILAAEAGSKIFAAASPERSVSVAPGDISGLVQQFSEEATLHAFSAAAAVAGAPAAAMLPVFVRRSAGSERKL